MRAVYRVIGVFYGNDADFSELSLFAPKSQVIKHHLGSDHLHESPLMPPTARYQAMHSLAKARTLTFSKHRRET